MFYISRATCPDTSGSGILKAVLLSEPCAALLALLVKIFRTNSHTPSKTLYHSLY